MEQINLEKPDIKSELIRIVYSAVPQSLIAILICSTVLAYIQWDYVPHVNILLWFAVTNGLSLLRLFAYKKFNTLDAELPVSDSWNYFALFSSIASGVAWGAVAIWLFPPDDIAHQVILAFIVAGMCAGAVTTLSPMLSSLIAFVILAIIPIVIRFVFIETDVAYAMAFTAAVFAVLILLTARNLNHILKESLYIRHEQRLAKDVIEHQALYDPLTDLPNRRLLIDKIKHEVARSKRHKYLSALLFLDLDFFKSINDSMGHVVGDELLKQVANRLKISLREEDTIARLGGDEFIILISNVGNDDDEGQRNIQIFTDKIMHLFHEEFYVNEQLINITTSIGFTMFPVSDATPAELLQKSDVAMYEAKSAGRNKIRQFVPEMQQLILNQIAIEKDLRKALSDNELKLYYQPLLDDENNIFSVEALLRWNHPEKGDIPPVEFIELAEKRGFIIQIGDWVMKQALNDLSVISKYMDVSMSINVSAHQFGDRLFVDKLKKVLAKTAVNPNQVRLEITESMVMDNVEMAIEKMKILANDGISFSIDDFGTGYSSLAYLKRLPVDLLKIDKSFVLDITNDSNDAVIVETILAMAHHMQIDVIAEGVETVEVLDFLKSKGCRKFQGYLFHRPMPLDELIKLITNKLRLVS